MFTAPLRSASASNTSPFVEANQDYRQILKDELVKKVTKLPSYSLRALARDAQVSPSLISSVLNGRKGFSTETAFQVCRALSFSKKKTEYFATLVQMDGAKSPELKSSLQDKLHELRPQARTYALAVDHFHAIAEWYHFAILELTQVKDFVFEPEAIAGSLGISRLEAESAVDRLVRLGLLEVKNQRATKLEDDVVVTSNVPAQALRKFHAQMLAKAATSLTAQSPQEKLVGSETFAFNERRLPEANAIIEDCFAKLIQLSKNTKNPTAVYHAGIQFFRLTKKENLK